MTLTGEQNLPIVKVTRNFQVTLPVAVRQELSIEKGDILEAAVQEDSVIFKPKVLLTARALTPLSKPKALRKRALAKP